MINMHPWLHYVLSNLVCVMYVCILATKQNNVSGELFRSGFNTYVIGKML